MGRQDADDEAGGSAEKEDGAPADALSRAGRHGTLAAASSQAVLGWLAPASTATALVVDFAGNAAGPLRARATVRLDDAAVARAVATRQPVALLFEEGDATRPIVIGLVQESPSPLEDLLRKGGADETSPEARRPPSIEADVDGKRVVISAEHEITLTCGEASITLRRDGKILLRGKYVETYSQGLNRIKGAQVKIN